MKKIVFKLLPYWATDGRTDRPVHPPTNKLIQSKGRAYIFQHCSYNLAAITNFNTASSTLNA